MASITTTNSGIKRILFYDETRTRRTLYVGRISDKDADSIRRRIESILSAKILGQTIDQDDAMWLAKSPQIREKLEAIDLIKISDSKRAKRAPTLTAFLDDYLARSAGSRKPGTVAVWKQVVGNLNSMMPKGNLLRK